tara:strand:+ start:8744 stop:9841 length:1098 start_codon:yes stop_codon:yes gene_type:complete
MIKIKDVIKELELWAPPALQESYDNAQLIVGDANQVLEKVLLSLDCIEAVVDEAIELGCNLIVAHHPIVFSGLKSLTGKNYIERTIIKAIKNNIAIYAIHTNLDNVKTGVNFKIAEKLGLENVEILSPKKGLLEKLVFYCPAGNVDQVRESVFAAGAGKIGAYNSCSFNSNGIGTFKAGEQANPHVGEIGKMHREEEVCVETIVPIYLKSKVINALLMSHPYEEVAFDFYPLSNSWNEVGSGMIGELSEETDALAFLKSVKSKLNTPIIRHTKIVQNEISKVAICGGSGSFLLNDAKKKGAEIFITADYKYHQFFDAEDQIVIADVGHYESEQFTPELIKEYLQQNFPNFALYLSEVNTNPINYL